MITPFWTEFEMTTEEQELYWEETKMQKQYGLGTIRCQVNLPISEVKETRMQNACSTYTSPRKVLLNA